MNEASRTISKCCDVQQVSNGETWQSIDDDRFNQVITTLGCEYCEWREEAVNLAIDSLIEENSLSYYLIVIWIGTERRQVWLRLHCQLAR